MSTDQISQRQLSRRQLAVGLGVAPALAACTVEASVEPEAAGPKLSCTVILVRHTEKVGDGSRDPELTEAGKARAEDFARMFEHAGVTALLHSNLIRTRDTVAPLSQRTGVASEGIDPADMDAWIARLSGYGAGDVVAVAGHSNTIPALAHAFGVLLPDLEAVELDPPIPHGFLPHGAYDRVHVLTPGADGARLLEMRYGAPS